MTTGDKTPQTNLIKGIFLKRWKTTNKGKGVVVKNISKQKIIRGKVSNKFYINYSKILKRRRQYLKGLPSQQRERSVVGSFIFDFVMDKILHDMIDNKNVFKLPYYGVELGVFMGEERGDPFFAIDTTEVKKLNVIKAHERGYKFNVYVSRRLRDKMDDKIFINKERFRPCKRSTGRQSLELYRMKCQLSSTSKHKRKE
jgi:hypothetical protein